MEDRAGYEPDARVRAAEASFAQAQAHFLPVLYAIRHIVEEAQARVSRARQDQHLQRILSERAAEYREGQANGEPHPLADWNPLVRHDAAEDEPDEERDQAQDPEPHLAHPWLALSATLVLGFAMGYGVCLARLRK